MARRPALVIFAGAFTLRLAYVLQISDLPWFDVPLIDGANYFRLAQAIAAGDLLGGTQAFWQPPLYPYFLAALLTLAGPRFGFIFTAQAALGALSCVLAYLLGRRVFGAREGTAAGAIMAIYGPLVHFDAQPLIPVVHIFLGLAGLLVLLRADADGPAAPGRAASTRRTIGGFAAAGLLWGLAALATPNVLVAAPPVAIWIALRRREGFAAPLHAAAAAAFLAGLALPVGASAARNLLVAGEPVVISSNGGINFFIGNNPDYARTVRIRPGGEFERLAQEPENLGIVSAAARSRWFAARGWRFLREHPGAAARLYLRKTLDLAAGREIPRNQDPYAYREHSSLLALLLWRAGVAFPFGVVAPLALAGACLRQRGAAAEAGAPRGDAARGRALLVTFAVAYAVSIVMFFPADRYRLPLVPILALFAGNLVGGGRAAWRRPGVAALLAGLVLFNLDAMRPRESFPEEEALNRAYAHRMKGETAAAVAEYRRAITLNPGRIDAPNALGAMAAQAGRWEEAAQRYRDVVERAPDFVDARRNLGQAYLALGRIDEARREWHLAVNLAPGAGLALADLCLSYLSEGAAPAAEPWCRRAVAARPDLADTHMALGLVARALRQRDVARAALREAARLFPRGSEGKRRAEEILEKMARRDAGEGPANY